MQLSAVQCHYTQGELLIPRTQCLGRAQLTCQKLFYRLCQQDYWDFLQQCEDTGIERLQRFVKQEQDSWIAKYDEAVEKHKVNGGPSELGHPGILGQ